MKEKRIYIFIGTTAELIKLAPVLAELKKRKISYQLISSGQGKLLFDELPKTLRTRTIDLGFEGKTNQSSTFYFLIWTIRTLILSLLTLKREFTGLDKNNSYFIVHGDTVSSLLGAITAATFGLKLVHIESGLRSFNFFEPFPEELCRYIISKLSDIHFCPNEWAMNNLKNKSRSAIVNTKQNTLIESFYEAMKEKIPMKQIKKKYYVMIIHRQEHVIFGKKWSDEMFRYIVSHTNKNLTCVVITHETTAKFFRASQMNSFISKHNIQSFSRLPYVPFMHLLHSAEYLVTDGGSNQEEMYYMGKPCLLLRKNTERIEGLGENVVLSKGDKRKMRLFLENYQKYLRKPIKIKERPSKIIVDYLINT